MKKNNRVRTLKELVQVVKKERRLGKSIVTTNGCFDIIHSGHVSNLEWAKKQGDILIVGVNSDASVKENKGDKRPVNSAEHRALVIAGLRSVDYVFIFDSKSPIEWIPILKPNIHIKGAGSEKSPAFLPERDVVEKSGGKVCLAPLVHGQSTTNIIERIVEVFHK